MFSQRLLAKLKNANSIAVLTGAGISAESGVPTFRGENGLWRQYRPDELANLEAFFSKSEISLGLVSIQAGDHSQGQSQSRPLRTGHSGEMGT